MRAAGSSFAVLVLFACSATEAGAQAIPVPRGGGVNHLAFQAGSPAARPGGVEVAVTQKAAAEYTCTKITMRVIDNATGQTLATYSVDNPGENVTRSFTDLGSNRQVQVVVTAVFAKGETIDSKTVEALVTTQ